MTNVAFLTDLFKNVCVSYLPLSEMRKFAKLPVETVILSRGSVAGCTAMFTRHTFKGRLAMLNIIDYFCFGVFFLNICTVSSTLFIVRNLLFFFCMTLFVCLFIYSILRVFSFIF